MQKWIILIVVVIIVIIGVFIAMNVSVETEYIPETEIEETELRKTIVSLYFKDKQTGELTKETRMVDSKILLRDPYEELINLLISGPENENYEKIIPDEAKVLEVKFENSCVTINFSKEFEENSQDDMQKTNSVYSVLNTLKQFTEVNNVKILVDGQEVQGITDLTVSIQNVENSDINTTNTANIVEIDNNTKD